MKQFSLDFSPLASADLQDIESYILEQSKEPRTARDTARSVLVETQRLKEFPDLGLQLDEYLNVKTDYRMLIAGNYNVFYRTENTTIKIVRIFSGKQDWMTVLFGKDTSRPQYT